MLHTWFPKTVYVEDNVQTDSLPLYQTCIEQQLRLHGSHRHGLHYVESSHSSFSQFHLLNEMQSLIQEIRTHAHDYLTLLGYNEQTIASLNITRMWANISQQGDYLYPHVHGESLLSGAYYVSCDQSDTIKFFNDLSETFLRAPDFASEYNYQYCEYECLPGRLLLFKSNFLHGTEAQKSKQKVVLSFNLSA